MRTQNWLVAAGIGAALCLGAGDALAQNGGGGGGGGFGGAAAGSGTLIRRRCSSA